MSEDSIHWNNLSKDITELTDESLKNFRSEDFSNLSLDINIRFLKVIFINFLFTEIIK